MVVVASVAAVAPASEGMVLPLVAVPQAARVSPTIVSNAIRLRFIQSRFLSKI